MKVSCLVFRDFKLEAAVASDEEAITANPRNAGKIRRLRYSFVSMCHHPRRRSIYLGATNTSGDILLEFDLQSRRFKSCGYGRSGLRGPYEDKVHKGIHFVADEDALYFGTATLSGWAQMVDAEGGSLLRYDVNEKSFRCLARPTPGDFFQDVRYDPGRGKMYMFTRRGCFAVYDLKRGRTVRNETMGSTPHNGCIDDDGGVWGTYSPGSQAFYRYDPDADRFEFPGTAFPNAREAANLMYAGAGPVDSMLNGGDGFLYTASALGEVYRLEPRSATLDYLGKPFPGKRLPAMNMAADGRIYLAGGEDRSQLLARYSRDDGRFELLGPLVAADGTRCYRSHELVAIDGVVFVGETDHPRRSGYLWVCEL
jgi:hypothetical protein